LVLVTLCWFSSPSAGSRHALLVLVTLRWFSSPSAGSRHPPLVLVTLREGGGSMNGKFNTE
ncbi:hypothetical protein, partial [Legionella quateirensis]|uniref:hypothetical protein n=1 Tax=Legionella quateirensis TaxID=45072 RepID=UPI001EE766CB